MRLKWAKPEAVEVKPSPRRLLPAPLLRVALINRACLQLRRFR